MLIGLDLSTSVCGFCALKKNKKIEKLGAYVFKAETLYQKLQEFRSLIKSFPAADYIIEEPLKRHPQSSASTLCLLQRFNGMACAALMIDKHVEPILLNSETARKAAGIIVPSKKERANRNIKEIVLEQVQRQCDAQILFELNRNNKPAKYCYDAADAYVIAMAGYAQYKKQTNTDTR